MVGYLVKGEVSADLSEIRLDPKSLSKNPPQARQQNRSDEAIVIADQKILTFFESNGAQANPGSYASVFDLNLKALEKTGHSCAGIPPDRCDTPGCQRQFLGDQLFLPRG